jgi:hypothetical protein
MSTNSFFFFLQFIAPMGGCPSPWACGAYPRAGHDHGGEGMLRWKAFPHIYLNLLVVRKWW